MLPRRECCTDEVFWPYKGFLLLRANAVCERFLGSVRCECLDHLLIVNQRQLYRVLKEYVKYFNGARPHQGIGHHVPVPPGEPDEQPIMGHRIFAFPVLGGLHHDYRRSAGRGAASS